MTTELWHGSANIIETPQYGLGRPYNDYGLGFYCTENVELAKEWACTENHSGYANHYALDTDGLNILHLSDGYTTLHWLALLVVNRQFNVSSPIALRGIDYLKEYFLIDISEYDIIIGYRANDSYFSFARAFLNNTISLSQLSNAMRLGKLGEQVVLKSQKSFTQIRFLDYQVADGAIYYAKRKQRDDIARQDYRRSAAKEDLDGLFLRDLIREEVQPNDPRIR